MNQNNNNKKKNYKVFEIETKGKLIMSSDVINQIMFLHATKGKTEWSGILLYDVIRGNPSKPSEFVLKAKHIFLMDVGSHSYTEYETDGDIVDIYDKIDGAMEMKIGQIHTHHDMSAFFSAVDTDELQTNVDKHNYYLSLIVNFSGNYQAKVAFLSKIKKTVDYSFTDDSGKKRASKEIIEEDVMVIIDMEIHMEYANKFFYDRIRELVEKQKKKEEEKNKKDVYIQRSIYQYYGEKDQKYLENGNNHTRKYDKKYISLAKSLIAVDTELVENETLYILLMRISDSKHEEQELYYEYFSDNIGEVLLSAFPDGIAIDEIQIIMSGIMNEIRNYQSYPMLSSVVNRICKELHDFTEMYEFDDLEKEDSIGTTESDKAIKELDDELARLTN